jgi:hypothetical protein
MLHPESQRDTDVSMACIVEWPGPNLEHPQDALEAAPNGLVYGSSLLSSKNKEAGEHYGLQLCKDWINDDRKLMPARRRRLNRWKGFPRGGKRPFVRGARLQTAAHWLWLGALLFCRSNLPIQVW